MKAAYQKNCIRVVKEDIRETEPLEMSAIVGSKRSRVEV